MSFYGPQPRGTSLFTTRKVNNGGDKERVVDPADLVAVRGAISTAVLHADGSKDSASAYATLKARHLSTHFFIDFDGTIDQALDVAHMAYHGGAMNPMSIGIDLNLHGEAFFREGEAFTPYPIGHPRAAEMAQHPRPKTERIEVNGGRVKTWGYTPQQHRSLETLLRALVAIFPNVRAVVPKLSDGTPRLRVLEQPTTFRGIVGHLHSKDTRWDPGPGIDWLELERQLRRPGSCWFEDAPTQAP